MNFLFYTYILDGPIVRLNGGGVIRESQRLILTCIVDAYPSVDSYQWYKNDEKLNVSSLTSSLIIDKISKDDAGIYACLVKNTLRTLNGSSMEKYSKTQTRVTVECRIDCIFVMTFILFISRCTHCSCISVNHCRRSHDIKHKTSMSH